MEWLVESDWRQIPAALIMLSGAILAIEGTRRQIDGITRPIGDAEKAITWMRGFRRTIIGLAILGIGAAWTWQAPWLLALALIIGAGEVLESSLDVWALSKGHELQLGPRIRKR
jgi:hypothetical protein